MPLTDKFCKNATAPDKAKKFYDEKGLYLEVKPTGSKYWRFKYRYLGKEKKLCIGVYPEITLKQARNIRDEARKQLDEGLDPSQKKKIDKLKLQVNHENNFEAIAKEWLEDRRNTWTKRYSDRVLRALERDVFKPIGFRPISEITSQELLVAIKPIEKRGAIDAAHRALQYCGQIFRYAVASGRTERDITTDLKGALKTQKVQHYAHLKENELPELIQKIESYDSTYNGDLQTKLALKLQTFTFLRPGEIRFAKWKEFNFDKKEWRIPGERMKMRNVHIVPLSKQVLDILDEVKKISGHREYLFPGRNKPINPISENTLLYAMYRMGYHGRATSHGIRHTASTILNEYGFNADVIERQLAHRDRNKVRASYNHAQYLPERKILVQWWADFLESLRDGKALNEDSNVIEMKLNRI